MVRQLLELIGIDISAAARNVNSMADYTRVRLVAEARGEAAYFGKYAGLMALAGGIAVAVLVAAIAALVSWLTPLLGKAVAWGITAIVLIVIDGAVLLFALNVKREPVATPIKPPMATVFKGISIRPVVDIARPFAVPVSSAILAAIAASVDRRRRPPTVAESLAPTVDSFRENIAEGASQASDVASEFSKSMRQASRPAIFGAFGAALAIGWVLSQGLPLRRR